MKIGIDFGSTYSTISTFDEKDNTLKTLTLAEGESASIPSVVSVSKKMNKVSCGNNAKGQIGKKSVRIFEVFKMLLTEPDKDNLYLKGYDDEYTPEKVSTLFLDSVLNSVMERNHVSNLDEVCICVPEVWEKNVTTLDGRNILIDILQNKLTVKIKNIKIVTEPEAASAFYAYDYIKQVNQEFNGHLLLIDFGGGTLDITLTEVVSDTKDRMEITLKESGGVGENHPDSYGNVKTGDAGVAYFQRVLILALLDSGVIKDSKELDYKSPEFLSAFRDLELQIKDIKNMKALENEFGSYGTRYDDIRFILDDESKTIFTVEYDDEEVDITYQQLFRAYQDIIEPVLKSELDKINPHVKKHISADPCSLEAGKDDKFKIALVGGFGSFYLVKKQISDYFNIFGGSIQDKRTEYINSDKKELSVSLGAALLASNKVILHKIAHFSIGLMDSAGKKMVPRYAIKYHQVLSPDHIYFITNENGIPLTFACLYNNIDSFAIGFDDIPEHGKPFKIKKHFLEDMDAELKRDIYGYWKCGFSIDKHEVITFHLVPAVMDGKKGNWKPHTIKLDSYADLFDITNFDGD